MHDRPKDNDYSKRVRITGHDLSDERENISLEWQAVELNIGDTVELRLLAEGQGEPPSETRRSSESPSNLFSSAELAKELLQTVSDFEKQRSLSCFQNPRKANQQKNTRNSLAL